MKEPVSTPMRRLALIYPKAIGDFLFVLPALHTIRRAWPEAEITLVVKKKQAPLALPQKGVLADEVLVLGGGTGWRDIRRALAERRVETVVDLAGNDQSGLILAWRGGRRLRPHPADCKGLCAGYSPFAESMSRLPAGLHRVDELLAFARHLGAGETVLSFHLRLPDEAIEACEEMINRFDLRSGTVVALNLGASRDTKRWPAASFAALARDLIAGGYRVVLMGAREFSSDDHYDRRILEDFTREGWIDGERCMDLVTTHALSPSLQLQRDAHFLRYSGIPRLVVGNDTGPMHIAGSVGDDARNKTLSLFGPTNWGRYAPYDSSKRYPDRPAGEWNRVLAFNPGCGPVGHQEACRCYRRGCSHKTCLVELSPATVLENVLSMTGPS